MIPIFNPSGLAMLKKIVFIMLIMNSTAIADEIDFVWSEDNPNGSIIYYSRYEDGKWKEKTIITGDEELNILPALGSDSRGKRLAVWTTVDANGGSVLKYSIKENADWQSPEILSSVFNTNLAPVVIHDFDDRAWVFWAANDGADDDIYPSHWEKNHWTQPLMINNDNDVPDILPRAALDESNHLVVYWQQLQDDLMYREVSKKLIDGEWVKMQTDRVVKGTAYNEPGHLTPPPFFNSKSRATFHFPNNRKNPSISIQRLE
jgi:hypothetical protein